MSELASTAIPSSPTLGIRPNAKVRNWSRKQWLWTLPWLAINLLLILALPPWFLHDANLDQSYQFAIDYAVLHHFRFGTDFICTFGPWGFIYNNLYQPQLMGWMIAGQAIIASALFFGICRIAQNLGFRPRFAGIWVAVIIIWANMPMEDGLVLSLCLLPMFIRRTAPDQKDSSISYFVVLAMALAGLCKFTFLTTAIASLALIGLEDLWNRRLPKLALWFVAMLFIFWCVAGQGIADFPAYLLNSAALSSGYSEAMGSKGPDLYMLPTVAGISAILSILILARFWKSCPLGAIFAFLTTAGVAFVCFKEGFVRHDAHEHVATDALVFMSLICAPILFVLWYESPPQWGVICVRIATLSLVAVSMCCVIQTYRTFFSLQTFLTAVRAKPAQAEARLTTSWRWVWKGQRIFDKPYQSGLASVCEDCPIPHVEGSVDMYGFQQSAVIAAGLDYVPRPVSPGFQAWSKRLINMNRQSLLSATAPENLIFKPESIDNRYPSLEDGALWPEIMSRYTPTEMTPTGYLLMKRNPQARPYTMHVLSSSKYRLGENIKVPQVSTGAVWMQIKFTNSAIGELEKFFLRSPVIYIDVKTTDGRTNRFRLIPGMTDQGFILSPVITDSIGFLDLLRNQFSWTAVTNVVIGVEKGVLPGSALKQNITVTFKHLEITPISLQGNPLFRYLGILAQMSSTADHPFGTMLFTGPDGKWDLLAHPPMKMQLKVPKEARRIHVSMGIRPMALDKTDGVTFRVSAQMKDGATTQLFQRALEPRKHPQDRQQVDSEIELPAQCDRLIFETQAVASPVYCWGYWADIRFE